MTHRGVSQIGSSVSDRDLARLPGSAPALTHLQFICHLVLLYCLQPPLCTPCTSSAHFSRIHLLFRHIVETECLYKNRNALDARGLKGQSKTADTRHVSCGTSQVQNPFLPETFYQYLRLALYCISSLLVLFFSPTNKLLINRV